MKKFLCLMMMSVLMFSFSVSSFCSSTYDSNKAAELVAQMTLRQKIGQMIMPSFRNWSDSSHGTVKVTMLNDSIRKSIADCGFGGIVLFAENTQGTEQTLRLIDDMQSAIMSDSSISRIPMLMAVDEEGGEIVRLKTGTWNCGNMALAATNNSKLASESAGIIGSELKVLGFNVNFAPDADVNSNPSNPVIGVRSFSDSPQIVSEYVSAYIDGLNSANIAAAVKHFPGHGDTSTDSHTGLSKIEKSYDEIKSTELVPFQSAINNSVDIVMTAHIQFPMIETQTYGSNGINLPATLSKKIITDILRKDMGFNGVVSTDALGMGAIERYFSHKDSARLAINAGVDILLMPINIENEAGINSIKRYIDDIEGMVHSGTIPESRITESATRIIALKLRRNIISDTSENIESRITRALATVGSKANHDAEWKIAKAAVTVVKNDSILPFTPKYNENILLLCAYPNEVNSMLYTMERLKSEKLIPQSTAYEVICYKDKSVSGLADKIAAADYIIANSEMSNKNSINPSSSSGWQCIFLDTLIETAHSRGKKVTLISCQLPYDVARYSEADAILAVYADKGMDTIPQIFNGETVGYGPNIPAGVYSVFSKDKPTGVLPVRIREIDKDYNFTDEIIYERGSSCTEWNSTQCLFARIVKFFTDIISRIIASIRIFK